MRDIVYIVENEIVDKMDCIVMVQSFVGNVLTACNPKWSRSGKTVKDYLGNEYTIASVNHTDSTITLTPLGAWTFSGTTLLINKPTFFVGTPIATNSEWAAFSNNEANKVPFIWMVEPTREVFLDEYSTIKRRSDLRIVFLDSNDTQKWLTMDTHNNRLQALYYMVDEFVRVIQNNNVFFSDDMTYDVVNFTKFGKETAQGVEKNIIDANLTGLDLKITVSISSGCTNC